MSQGSARRRSLRSWARSLGLKEYCLENGLLDRALTHDSYSSERGRADRTPSNERLEFLGDAILGAVVAHEIYERNPALPEGVLSRKRAGLVSRAALAETANRLGIAPLLLLGRGEGATGGAGRPSILAGAFEAIVAAIYLSDGIEAARSFVELHHMRHASVRERTDPKTALQEYVQARFKKTPHYAVTAQSGPPHARSFSAAVSVAGTMMGSGDGATKKQAEAAAALAALVRFGRRPKTDER